MGEEQNDDGQHEEKQQNRIIALAKAEEATTTSKLNVFLWSTYDAADTVFAMAIISIVLFQWGELIGMKGGLTFERAHLLVSTFMMIANLAAAFLMPILGAHSDIIGKRKPMVIFFAILTILLTPLISISSNLFVGLILFTIANVTYVSANLYYESMIPYICEQKSRAKVSAFGVAFGFTGTIVAVLLVFFLPMLFGEATLADDVINNIVPPQKIKLNWVYWMFIFAALFYLLIAIPFLWTKEKTPKTTQKMRLAPVIKSSFVQLGRTLKEIVKENKDMLLFVLGWFLINDAVGTAIAVLVDFLREGLGFDPTIAGLTLFIGIIVGIAFLYFMGPIIDKRGPKFGLILTGIAWSVGIVLSVVSGLTVRTVIITEILPSGVQKITYVIYTLKYLVFLAAAIIAFGMGAVWVVGRQFVMELAPPKKVGQYFSFQKISGKISTAFGPMIFSSVLAVSIPFGKKFAYQIAILSLLAFFLIGFIIALFIRNYHQKYLQGERFPYKDEEKVIEQ